MADFDAKTDTPAASTDVAATDRFIFGDVSADGWDTIQAQNVLAALARLDSGPNFALGAATIGTSGTNTLALKNGTAPGSQPADEFQVYSADVSAGNAAMHVRGEGSWSVVGVGGMIVRQAGGVAGTDEVQLYDDGTRSWIETKQTDLRIRVGGYISGRDITFETSDGGNPSIDTTAGTLQIGNRNGAKFGGSLFANSGTGATIFGGNYDVGWNSTPAGNNPDSCIGRAAAGVLRTTDAAGTTPTWLQHTPADKRLTTAFTDNTGTLANLTDLSITLIAGRKYTGRLVLFLSTDQAAEGAKLDFDGGSATMTSFSAGITANVQGATLGTTVSSAIATDLTATALSGTGLNVIAVDFTCVVNAAGTFIPRLAQNSHTSGTLTAAIGSSLCMKDMP